MGFRVGHPRMCRFDMWILLSWRKSRPRNLRKSFYLPHNCLKEFRQRDWSRKRATTRDNYKKYGLGVVSWGKPGRAWRPVLSVSHCLRTAWQTFVYKTCALPIFPQIALLPFEVPDPHPLLLSSGWHISLYCLTAFGSQGPLNVHN